MFTASQLSTCPPLREEKSWTIYELIVWLALLLALLVTAFLDILVTWHQDEVKRIDKEAKILKALQKDYQQLQKQENEVESRARSFWYSELNLDGIRSKLSKAERQWVKSTEQLVDAVENCVRSFKEQTDRYGLTALLRLIPIWEVVCQIRKARRDIESHLNNKDKDTKQIYQSMEKSRSNYRSLLDRQPILEHVRTPLSKPSTHPTNLQELVDKSKHSFAGLEERWSIYLLLPLQAFLIDLSQLQLETETEKSWKTEAEELIEEAEVYINNFLWWASIFYKIGIVSSNIPIVTCQFKRNMRRIFTEFDELLGRKQKYGFNFNDTAAEKSSFPSTHQYTDYNNDSTSAVADILRKLSQVEQSSRQANHFISLLRSPFKELNDINNEIRKREKTTAGGNACLKQIKHICQETNQILKSYSGEVELKHYEQIENAVKRLKQITNVCNIITNRPKSVVGLKSDIRRLVSNLTTTTTTADDTHPKLAIVGMKGIGKTVLANEIFYNKTVADHFSVRVWMQVSRKSSETQVLLIRKDGKRESFPLSFINDHLKGETCLVVLDDVSSQQEWDAVKDLLSELSTGSRIVLTTCSKDVARHADKNTTLHQLRLQTKEESWELFNKVTPHSISDPYVEKLAKTVVGRCGGLPLAILSLGCLLLANGVTEEQLLRALKEINQGQNQTPWLQVWKENSKYLNHRETLRNCLYYFTLFPIDYEIPSRRLLALWDAEGLAKQNARSKDDDKETQEDDAEKCLEELRTHYMIQAVQLKANGKIKTCWLPSMLRELIQEDSNLKNRSQYYSKQLQRRFSYHVDDRGLDSNVANTFRKKEIPLSVIFFDKREGSKPGEHIGSIINAGVTCKQY